MVGRGEREEGGREVGKEGWVGRRQRWKVSG